MRTGVYNQKGEESGSIELSDAVFGLQWNADLVHQIVVSMQANSRANSAHTKDRGEVCGTGRKPWRQKGTGRARHGSRRSPIWRTGGVAHGPRNDKNYTKKISSNMKKKALYTVLSQKLRDGELLFVDKLIFPEPKTRDAKNVLIAIAKASKHEDIATRRRNATLIGMSHHDEGAIKSFNNIAGTQLIEARNLNPLDLLTYKYFIIENPKESLKNWE